MNTTDVNDKKFRQRHIVIWGIVAVSLLGFMIVIGWSFWNRYKNNIIDKQKEQMLLVATSMAKNMQIILDDYVKDVNNISDDIENIMDTLENTAEYDDYIVSIVNGIFQKYIDNDNGYVSNIKFKSKDGTELFSNSYFQYKEVYKDFFEDKNNIEFIEGKGNDGQIHFTFIKAIKDKFRVELTMDLKDYYDNLISGVKVGTNGYILMKNSDTVILMHPDTSQIGEEVLAGRSQLFPNLDLFSLEELVKVQAEQEQGIFEYYSYWWTKSSPQKVKKIASFDRAYFGSEYFIVSAVTDYSDIYNPIMLGFRTTVLTLLGIMVIFVIFIVYVFYLEMQQNKNAEEIQYLKDLNEVLEETKRGEEAIAHQQRLQIMETMTGGIAHEFNNMLTPIMGYAELLMMDLDPESDNYDSAKEIFEASEKAKDVIHQISGLSRKNMETVFNYIDVAKLLKRVMKMINSVCPVNIKTEFNCDCSDVGVLGNETQLNQVILNLCVNAFHAIGTEKKGFLNIDVTQRQRELIEKYHSINISKEWDKYVCITVKDNGIGMDKETMQKIFTPFFTTKISGQGTGLGLSVVEQIIHEHKGYIEVESKLGEGSTFFIYLPVADKESKYIARKDDGQLGEKLSLLVLDDNEKVLRLLEKQFAKLGIKISTANCTKDAKQLLSQKKFDVILIDEELSQTGKDDTGICFAMSIKEMYTGMLRIIMTNQVKKEIIEARQHGIIDTYIEKPVSDTQILDVIRKYSS